MTAKSKADESTEVAPAAPADSSAADAPVVGDPTPVDEVTEAETADAELVELTPDTVADALGGRVVKTVVRDDGSRLVTLELPADEADAEPEGDE